MYVKIADFVKEWQREAQLTQNVLDSLTDESLKQKVFSEGRTLGRIAWHFTTNIPEYLTSFGVEIEKVDDEKVPLSSKRIADTFKSISSSVVYAIENQWTDETLEKEQIAFGRQESNATILMGLIKHIVHHRGQLTVLMRQAGIKPPGVYGPPKEDWIHFGVKNPPL